MKNYLYFAVLFSFTAMASPIHEEIHTNAALNVEGILPLTTVSAGDPTASFHKYYLSVSNVTFSPKAKALQMISRYFIDDLEDVLNERQDKKLQLGNAKDLEDLKPILERYFSKRIGVKVDGKVAIPTVIGAEYDVDQIVVYIEIPALKEPSTIEMSNKSLFELFPEQKNLTHFNIHNERKSLLNSGDTPIDRVKF